MKKVSLEQPKVTVLMSVYNGEQFLSESIESLLSQSLTDFEFVIINDGCTDQSPRILASYAKADARIRLINQENVGLVKSLNIGAAAARGEYIARMDAGDISHQDRLLYETHFLDANPSFALVSTSYDRIDWQGRIINSVLAESDAGQLSKRLLDKNCFCHGAAMFRASIFQKLGGYNERFKFSQDYELFSKMAVVAKTSNLERILYQWRFDDTSITYNNYLDQYFLALQISQINRARVPGADLSKEFDAHIGSAVPLLTTKKKRMILSQRYFLMFTWLLKVKEVRKGIYLLYLAFITYPFNKMLYSHAASSARKIVKWVAKKVLSALRVPPTAMIFLYSLANISAKRVRSS